MGDSELCGSRQILSLSLSLSSLLGYTVSPVPTLPGAVLLRVSKTSWWWWSSSAPGETSCSKRPSSDQGGPSPVFRGILVKEGGGDSTVQYQVPLTKKLPTPRLRRGVRRGGNGEEEEQEQGEEDKEEASPAEREEKKKTPLPPSRPSFCIWSSFSRFVDACGIKRTTSAAVERQDGLKYPC
ncbi:hypothetical protein LZ31DRAFT_255940 [Colletotrichum somersetense]|nr:hypothetical protein LZ31DRAFT_255940 [Colletotrichum somersetense]